MDKLNKIFTWLKQPSTIKGITIVLGLVGVAVTPELKEQILTIATMVYGALALFYDKG